MSVTSYAQNFEDVILLRALRHIERGFYIDIGAQDPIKYSVTKTFYELGWRGINIEPVSHWFSLLEQDRAHDINLNVAVSDTPGSLRLYEVLDTGLSTTEEVYARRHTEAGFEVQEVTVPCVTLDSICEGNGVSEVHFLKVDCEGAETSAFRGFSFDKVRPWIIVVEATEPLSQKPAYSEWEPILLDHAYQFVYADGLNRFYLANEHRGIAGAFELPPNVFDAFVPADVVHVNRQLELVQSQLKMLADVERAVRAESERDRVQGLLVQSQLKMLADVERAESERDRVQWLLVQSSVNAEHLKGEFGRKSNELDRVLAELGRMTADLQRTQSDLGAITENVRSATLEIGQLQAERRGLNEHIQRLTEVNCRLDEKVRTILSSKSWRYTSLLRLFMRIVRGNVGAREAARVVATRGAGKLARSHSMRVVARTALFPFPSLRDRLRGIAKRGLGIEQAAPANRERVRDQPVVEIVLSKSGVEALLVLHTEIDRKFAAMN